MFKLNKLCFLILLILIVGCKYQVQQIEENKILNITDDTIENENTKVKTEVKKFNNSSEFPERNFEIDELKDFLSKLLKEDSLFRRVEIDEMGQSLFLSSRRIAGIQIIEDKSKTIKNIDEFLKFVDNPDWKLWRYYDYNDEELYPRLNERQLKELFPYENYGNKHFEDWEIEYYLYSYDYKDYLDDSTFVDYDQFEVPAESSYGIIPEYRMTRTAIDQYNNWKSNFESPLLIYKIPCSKDIIIYFKPVDTGFQRIGTSDLKKSKALIQWKSIVKDEWESRKKVVDAIMGFCGINKDNLATKSFQSYEEHKEYTADDDRLYYRLLNGSLNVDVQIKQPSTGNFKITGINMQFKTFGEKDFKNGVNVERTVKVQVFVNKSGIIENYGEWSLEKNQSGKNYNKKLSIYLPDRDLNGKNINLIFIPYIEESRIDKTTTTVETDKTTTYTIWDNQKKHYIIGRPIYWKVK